MIDFLPVTWKCCFYSAHFQPGGLFLQYFPYNNGYHFEGMEQQRRVQRRTRKLCVSRPGSEDLWSEILKNREK